jgi:cytochrome c peroxidase
MANNGLDKVFSDIGYGKITGRLADNGKFRIPSMRNVELTAPYMHDGRFDTLEEVLDFYSDGMNLDSPNLHLSIAGHSQQLQLTNQQKTDIIEFLKTLTDNTYLSNAEYGDPF